MTLSKIRARGGTTRVTYEMILRGCSPKMRRFLKQYWPITWWRRKP